MLLVFNEGFSRVRGPKGEHSDGLFSESDEISRRTSKRRRLISVSLSLTLDGKADLIRDNEHTLRVKKN